MQIFLAYHDIALASSLIIIVLLISWRLRLKLSKTLLVAAFRTVIQLSFIGLILAWIFAREQWYEVLLILTVMTLLQEVPPKIALNAAIKGY